MGLGLSFWFLVFEILDFGVEDNAEMIRKTGDDDEGRWRVFICGFRWDGFPKNNRVISRKQLRVRVRVQSCDADSCERVRIE